jgi:serine/threonine protein kinase
MEQVRGRSLDDLVHSQGPLGAREAALVGIDLCRALAAVHGAGLVHRDVKAGNVMREQGGRIVLMDFGASHETVVASDRIVGRRSLLRHDEPLPEEAGRAPIDTRVPLSYK